MGVAIAEPTVRVLVRRCRQGRPAAYVPLAFGPGERAEFDFGHAAVVLGGEGRRVPYLAGRLRYSGAVCVWSASRPSGRSASCWGSGTPSSSGRGAAGGGVRQPGPGGGGGAARAPAHRAGAFAHSAACTGSRRCSPARRRAGRRPTSENLVGYARRTFLVPVPAAADLPALNARLPGRLRAGPGAGDGRPEEANRRPAGGRAGRRCCRCPPGRRSWGCCGRCWPGPRRGCASRPTTTPCRWAWWAGTSPCAPTRCTVLRICTPGRSWWPSTRAATGGTKRSRTSPRLRAAAAGEAVRGTLALPALRGDALPPASAAYPPRAGGPLARGQPGVRPRAGPLPGPPARKGHRGAGAGRGRRALRCRRGGPAAGLGRAAPAARTARPRPPPRAPARVPPPDLSRYNRLLAGAEGGR